MGRGSCVRLLDVSRADPMMLCSAQRIVCYGVTGTGKSTLAGGLAAWRGLPLHLADDEIGWLPKWQERPIPAQRMIAEQVTGQPRWVLDTAYGSWRDIALARAELLIGLDFARVRSLTWLLRRTIVRAVDRREVCNGNVESWRQLMPKDSIVRWHFKSFNAKRSRIRRWENDAAAPPVLRICSPRQFREILKQIGCP